jgi:hypothetical protein
VILDHLTSPLKAYIDPPLWHNPVRVAAATHSLSSHQQEITTIAKKLAQQWPSGAFPDILFQFQNN